MWTQSQEWFRARKTRARGPPAAREGLKSFQKESFQTTDPLSVSISCALVLLTLSFHFVRAPTPNHLPRVLQDLEGPPLGPQGLLVVKHGQDRPHLHAAEEAEDGLPAVRHPGAGRRAAAESGRAHRHRSIAELQLCGSFWNGPRVEPRRRLDSVPLEGGSVPRL